jgi:hypothetical protein
LEIDDEDEELDGVPDEVEMGTGTDEAAIGESGEIEVNGQANGKLFLKLTDNAVSPRVVPNDSVAERVSSLAGPTKGRLTLVYQHCHGEARVDGMGKD